MAVPLLLAVGTGMQIFGQLQANMAQARQEIENAKFYEEQAKFALEAMHRQEDIASRQYEARKGAQVSAYAKGGVDLSGSAALTIAETVAQKAEELSAIKRKGELDYKLAKLRARSSQAQGEMLQSTEYNFMQAGGTALTAYAQAGAPGFGKGKTGATTGGHSFSSGNYAGGKSTSYLGNYNLSE